MDFEKICKTQVTPLDPKKVLVEFLKYNPDIFNSIFRNREDIYKEILGILLEKEKVNLNMFIGWYRCYLYDY